MSAAEPGSLVGRIVLDQLGLVTHPGRVIGADVGAYSPEPYLVMWPLVVTDKVAPLVVYRSLIPPLAK